MAVALRAWVDRGSVVPGRDAKVHLVVEIEASGQAVEEARPPSATMLALDVSGSMQGIPLDQVVRSVDRILDALRPDDRVGVVAFSDEAAHVVGPCLVDAAGKRLVRSRVASLVAGGNTNVEAGIELAAKHLADALADVGGPDGRPDVPGDVRRAVLVLSDGVPNRGASLPDAIREVVRRHRPGVTFASLGYGIEHSEDFLSAIGEAGGGGYELVQDPAACARSFARALGAQADVVAAGLELTIAPADGAEVAKMLGREESRFGRDGIVLSLPDMVPGARRVVVAEVLVRAPGDARFVAPIARLRLRFRALGSSAEGETVTEDVSIEVADREPAVLAEAAGRVLLVRADVVRAEARAMADRGNFGGAAATLRALLAEIDRLPGFSRGDGSTLGEAYELLVDEAVAMERRPSGEAYAAFRKNAVASRLAAHAPPSSRGVASSKLIDLAAGSFPEAYVVVVTGAHAGERYRLRAECVIGRSASADLPLASNGVSRRHAEIYAAEGEFWACDLGSTSPTEVNGVRLLSAPAKLRDGDLLRVGDVELRYEEKRPT